MLTLRKTPEWASRYDPETGSALREMERERPRKAVMLLRLALAEGSVSEIQGGFIRDVPATTEPGEVEAVALRELFAKTFPTDPEGAVDLLRRQVWWGSSRQAAVEVLLPYLAGAGYGS